MKKIYISVLAVFSFISLASAQLINEFEPNPIGADLASQSIELKGTPGASFSGVILTLESDSDSNIGTVDRLSSVSGTFGSNGVLVVTIPDLENPSFTIVLAETFTGSKGDDLDVDNDGVLENISSLVNVYDAINIPDDQEDESNTYASQLGGTNLPFIGGEPEILFRNLIDNQIYVVDNTILFDERGIDQTSNFPSITVSFGVVNDLSITLSSYNSFLRVKPTTEIYPNPTNGKGITIKTIFDKVTVEVYTTLGSLVLREEVVKGKILSTSILTKGTYFVKISNDTASTTEKLIVK